MISLVWELKSKNKLNQIKMESLLEEMHHDFVSSDNYYPRLIDIEYEYWALHSERPSNIKNEDCK